ncbi:uncharacterized protein si:dkey-106l3.7 isoform X2 [Entelurus aequoreus]|uniref:uncharacterized protein si:dkey-106l3.7 isoform X2 n=1 Tax=Entelurus aequoreus TaxID=161455 RepID=UPI002B1D564F|nr:uncharacterized protein si:dkey-106l3.7 isoform X2 [Entelurus aequoreus]
MMEVWVAEQIPEADLLEDIPEDSPKPLFSPSHLDRAARAESVDSGVETASTDTWGPASPEADVMDPTDSFRSFSSLGSMSLPSSGSLVDLSLNSTSGSSRLKNALQRIESRRQSRRPDAQPYLATPRCARTSVQMLEGVHLQTQKLLHQNPETRTFFLSSKEQGLRQVESEGLSPGFVHLEEVCRRLEILAREKRLDMDVLSSQEHADAERRPVSVIVSFHGDDGELLAGDDADFLQDPRRRLHHRSSSDTTLASLGGSSSAPTTCQTRWSKTTGGPLGCRDRRQHNTATTRTGRSSLVL